MTPSQSRRLAPAVPAPPEAPEEANSSPNHEKLSRWFDVGEGPPPVWTCVRTRPRWEKKFARWLTRRGEVFFLPSVRRETVSFRHRRITDKLLFPGYIFIARDCQKGDFSVERSVVRLLKATSPAGNRGLHEELRLIWRGIQSGVYLRPVNGLALGESCEIVEGPLRGMQGRYEKKGRQGHLVLTVAMLGMGVAVEVPIGWLVPLTKSF